MKKTLLLIPFTLFAFVSQYLPNYNIDMHCDRLLSKKAMDICYSCSLKEPKAVVYQINGKLISNQSKTVKRDLEEAFFINPEKVEVIYNPIDVERVRKLSEEPLTEEEEEIFNHPVIVNVARHEPQKGLHHLINIFERVYRELPETRLVLIGDGSLRRELEKQVSDKVVLVGDKRDYERSKDWRGVVNLAGKLSLIDSLGVLKGAKLFVGNDSGATHMARAVGTKVAVFFGGTHPCLGFIQ
jgi:ADP-heptose:LPS heptosyltransferase